MDSGYVVSRNGTRPGSAMADAMFHVLMSCVTRGIKNVLAEEIESDKICASVGFASQPVVCADDLALCLLSHNIMKLFYLQSRVLFPRSI